MAWSRPASAAERSDLHARIESKVRALVGDQVGACERLEEFVIAHTVPWPGRALDDERADPIIAAEFGRARKTYAAAIHLVLGGFGPQAAMLNRSLFEGMALAHWASAHPAKAMELFERHERHSALLWGDAVTGAGWFDRGEVDAGTDAERNEFRGLFGPYGHKPWTGHANLREVVLDIEDQWPQGEPRDELWAYYRVGHRDNNQLLHSSSTALMGGARSDDDTVAFDSSPSALLLDRALLGSYWCFIQTVTLLWDHFELAGREALDALTADIAPRFRTVDPSVAQRTGRNHPCPCGSGRKFKRCHGA